MTDKPAAFIASYADWKLIRTRKCVQVVFEIPLEKATEAFAALGGMPNPAAERWFGIAALNPSKMEVPSTMSTTATSPKSQAPTLGADSRVKVRSLAQLAGIYCTVPSFQNYLNTIMPIGFGPVHDKESAAEAVRRVCGVTSRAEIIMGTIAGDAFEGLAKNWHDWELADRYVEVR